MTNESSLEFVGKMIPKKLISIAEDCKKELEQILADREHWAKYGTNHSKKSAQSKREIMEELSRKRFPWEEKAHARVFFSRA
ncbi:MAG: hypothetical protein B7Y05_23300 [Polynucleobacter sp. 24-46-87]|jgi:hypothetical protein|nr:MAG: hypothetical protein B7Y05_23300 [Polynucleobacter sp. 24-46-87]